MTTECKSALADFKGVPVTELTAEDLEKGMVRVMREPPALQDELRELYIWGQGLTLASPLFS